MSFRDISQSAADWALAQVGSSYSQAKRLKDGIFDCSSLVARAYAAQGKRWRYGGSVPVSTNEVYDDDFELLWPGSYAQIGDTLGGKARIELARQAGDLQFLCTDSSTSRSNRITHVAMVVSDSKIVHARGTKYGVRTDSIDLYSGKLCAVVRYNPSGTLCSGMKGFRSLALQQALNQNGADLLEDGEFGEKTQAALKIFQKARGLREIGVTNEETLDALGINVQGTESNASDNPNQQRSDTVRVTGESVHIRTGPSTTFSSLSIAHKGDQFEQVDADGWFPILLSGNVCWISGKYSILETQLSFEQ